jgi:hypothetical protein
MNTGKSQTQNRLGGDFVFDVNKKMNVDISSERSRAGACYE